MLKVDRWLAVMTSSCLVLSVQMLWIPLWRIRLRFGRPDLWRMAVGGTFGPQGCVGWLLDGDVWCLFVACLVLSYPVLR